MMIKPRNQIKKLIKYQWLSSIFIINFTFCPTLALASESILQQESLSFERCLKVIDVSADKLSVAPQIFDLSANNRVASFKLLDGTLKIICDGEQGLITVSTEAD